MLFMVVLSFALATTTTAVATTAPTSPATIAQQTGQRKALYQSELEQNLLLRSQMGYTFIAAYGPFGPTDAAIRLYSLEWARSFDAPALR
jgi:hypothetical protein